MVINIKILERNTSNQAQILHEFQDQMIPITSLQTERLNETRNAILFNTNAIQHIINQTRDTYDKIISLEKSAAGIENLYINMLQFTYSGFSRFAQHVQALMLYHGSVESRLLTLQAATSNKLSPLLVSPQIMEQICIIQILHNLRLNYPMFHLSLDRVYLYYHRSANCNILQHRKTSVH